MKGGAKGKAKTKAKAKNTLMVDSKTGIPELEKLLSSGNITIVLVYAEWCGACHKFRNGVWDPMLKNEAIHNRVSVRDDMVRNTSLSKAKFDYLPSILVVDEKGDIQTFKTPEGNVTNAMPTPRNVEDMTRIVNVPVMPLASTPYPINAIETIDSETDEAEEEADEEEEEEETQAESNNWLKNQITKYNYTNVIPTQPIATPKGTTYVPIQGGARRSISKGKDKGNSGSLLKTLETFIKRTRKQRSHRLKIGRQTRKYK
jgi:thiol-disulfide isomerase/thioredoxin